MIKVKCCENERGKLPVCVAQVFVVTFSVHTVRDSLLLLDHTYQVGDIDLVFLVICLQV